MNVFPYTHKTVKFKRERSKQKKTVIRLNMESDTVGHHSKVCIRYFRNIKQTEDQPFWYLTSKIKKKNKNENAEKKRYYRV